MEQLTRKLSNMAATKLRHDPINLVAQDPDSPRSPGLTASRGLIQRRPPDLDCMCAHSQRLDHISAAPKAAVDQYRMRCPTASRTGGSASMGEMAPSRLRPPWLETTTPSAPQSAARVASAGCSTPFEQFVRPRAAQCAQVVPAQGVVAHDGAADRAGGETLLHFLRVVLVAGHAGGRHIAAQHTRKPAGAAQHVHDVAPRDGERQREAIAQVVSRLPGTGPSTVTTSASKPAFFARSTNRWDSARSGNM